MIVIEGVVTSTKHEYPHSKTVLYLIKSTIKLAIKNVHVKRFIEKQYVFYHCFTDIMSINCFHRLIFNQRIQIKIKKAAIRRR